MLACSGTVCGSSHVAQHSQTAVTGTLGPTKPKILTIWHMPTSGLEFLWKKKKVQPKNFYSNQEFNDVYKDIALKIKVSRASTVV